MGQLPTWQIDLVARRYAMDQLRMTRCRRWDRVPEDLHAERARIIAYLRSVGGTWQDAADALGLGLRHVQRLYGPGKGRNDALREGGGQGRRQPHS